MIDIENDVFDHVCTQINAVYPKVSVDGEYDDLPAELPAVSIAEKDNSVFRSMRTRKIENAVRVMYEGTVFSSKTAGKRAEAKAITQIMDEAFEELGFTRTMQNPVPNYMNASIIRIVSRYEAVVAPKNDGTGYMIYQI